MLGKFSELIGGILTLIECSLNEKEIIQNMNYPSAAKLLNSNPLNFSKVKQLEEHPIARRRSYYRFFSHEKPNSR